MNLERKRIAVSSRGGVGAWPSFSGASLYNCNWMNVSCFGFCDVTSEGTTLGMI